MEAFYSLNIGIKRECAPFFDTLLKLRVSPRNLNRNAPRASGRVSCRVLMQQLLLELAPPPPPTLENFSPGKNGAALKALREALESGERFVFVWGGSGSGKTHLLRGFAEAAKARRAAVYIAASNADWARAGALEAAAVDDVARLDEPGQIGRAHV